MNSELHFKLYTYVGLVTKSCPTLATPWIVVWQAPLSMGLLRQEYWSGLPLPSPGNLPDFGMNQHLLHRQADSLPLSHQENCIYIYIHVYVCI